MAEAARHEDPGRTPELLADVVGRERLGVDPAHGDVMVLRPGRMVERLGHRQVRVGQLDVLADERDLQARAWAA